MNYQVILSQGAVEDVLQITISSMSKASVIEASKQLQRALGDDPPKAGTHLSEGLFYIDREPLRAYFTIDHGTAIVEIVHVRQL